MPNLNLPTPNKTPGDGAPADDINLVIEAVNTLNSAVDNIPAGPQGPQGEPGTPGAAGANASVTIGSTTTSAPGSNAAVTNSGTAQNSVFNFTIPRGETGPQGAQGPQGPAGPAGENGLAAAISIGTVTTGAPESNATVTNSGTTSNAVFNFSIPRGSQGEPANLGNATPQNLGTAAAGTSTSAARQDHVHNMPSAADVGADPAGSAASAQAAAEGYADSLASNYDPAGSASAVAGDLTTHEGLTTSVHGITDTADLVYTNDARLSDARTPTAHATSHESGGTDELELAPSQITGTAVVDSDPRLTDARTPTAHAASHESGGTDELELAPSQITGTAVVDNDARLSDARTPTAHATSHEFGGTDELELAPGQITGTAIVASTIDAKGDLLVGTAADTIARLPVGTTDGFVLTVDSNETAGVKWAVAAAPVDDPFPVGMFLGGM